jgi:GT2 family glycosyltransferase
VNDSIGVSIVIPNLHSPIIGQVLAALRRQSWRPARLEVLVVGLDKYGLVVDDETVRGISTGEPVGPARARNIGWRQTQHEWIIFLDADCVPAADWLAAMAEFIEAHPDAGAVLAGMDFERLPFLTVCDQIATFHEHLHFNPSGVRLTVPTYSLWIPRTVLERTSGFDESFLIAGEDLDITARIGQLGYHCYFNSKAVVFHNPPQRNTLGALLLHAYRGGRGSIRTRWRFRQIYHTPAWAGSPVAWRVLAMPIAFIRTLQIMAHVAGHYRCLSCVPFVFLAKLAWCLGAANGIAVVHSEEAR